MNEAVLKKIKEDIKYKYYLRDNPSWYKTLTRNPELVTQMVKEMKEKYGLRFRDKLENVNNVIEILNALKESEDEK